MERIIKEEILNHLCITNSLSDCQHSFVRKRSCLTNLVVAEETITKYLDNRETVDVVFLDFAKAFDSVNHRMLILKLEAYVQLF